MPPPLRSSVPPSDSPTSTPPSVATASTNSTGDYEFPSVRVGTYTISASNPGFADAVAKNILVSIGNRQRIDLTLKVGSTETTIQVKASPCRSKPTQANAARSSPTTKAPPCLSLLAITPTSWHSSPAPARPPPPSSPAPATRSSAPDPSTSTASAPCSTTSCSTDSTTTPTANPTRASTTRSSPSRRIP